jgi:uracil-DNA glycosylase
MPISVENYTHMDWKERFPDGKVKMEELNVHSSWKPIFKEIRESEPDKWAELNDILSDHIKFNDRIFPYPDLVFEGFNKTPFDKVKVVIVGQDCYFNEHTIDKKDVPEAMGMSFSVPIGITIPSSLKNIFNNAVKFKHMFKYPEHGNLEFWAGQGCLLMNAALTVIKKTPNCHAHLWHWFTDKIIQKLSDKHNKLVFVLWGSPALGKVSLIDGTKHHFIISSHPSGLSCNKPLKTYPAFVDQDHFGKINEYLEKNKKKKIIWQIA